MKLRLRALLFLLLCAQRRVSPGLRRRRRVLAGDGPVLIVNGDTAVLARGGRRAEGAINVPAYHVMKTIAHIPLTIFVAVTAGDEVLDPERLKTLETLRRLIPPARSSLDSLNLSAPVLARQDRIVKESLALIDDAIARRRLAANDLQSFTRRMSPLVMANVADATRAQLDINMDEQDKQDKTLVHPVYPVHPC